MDVMGLLFSAKGRLGPKGLWTGLLIVLGLQIAMSLTVFVAPLGIMMFVSFASIILLWPMACVLAKRFHDAGLSGWLAAAVIVGTGVLSMIVSPLIMTPPTPPTTTDLSEVAAYTRTAAQQTFLPSTLLNIVICGIVGFAMASLKASPGDNQYGPPPAV